jgi:threonine synthase
VTVLYPKGRVSPLQERQIAGLGGNIDALAVEGSFDDCQRMVKAALGDESLKKRLALSSANSINVARLIPQGVYYAAAAGRAFAGGVNEDGEATPRDRAKERTAAPPVRKGNFRTAPGEPIVFCVPSGNFGNLTAGLYAKKMGAPVKFFIAATNINKTVPDYLQSGSYEARPSRATISNAMDVGAPSNFERMASHWSLEELRGLIRGVSVTDDETRRAIAAVHGAFGYFLDPHGAVGWEGVNKLWEGGLLEDGPVAVLGTAHPAKFGEVVEPLAGKIPPPPSLVTALERVPQARTIPVDVSALVDSL